MRYTDFLADYRDGAPLTMREIRSMTGLSQAAFSKKYGIPKRSLENWESGVSSCPDYVLQLLLYAVQSDIDQ